MDSVALGEEELLVRGPPLWNMACWCGFGCDVLAGEELSEMTTIERECPYCGSVAQVPSLSGPGLIECLICHNKCEVVKKGGEVWLERLDPDIRAPWPKPSIVLNG